MVNHESDGPAVRIKVAKTFGDYRRYCQFVSEKRHGRLQWWLKWLFVLGVCIAMVYDYNRSMIIALAAFLAAIGVSVFAWIISKFQIRKGWKAGAPMLLPITYDFSPSEIRWQCSLSEGRMTWKNIVSAEKAGPIIFLKNLGETYHVVPESAFENEVDRRVFQQLVEANVPQSKL